MASKGQLIKEVAQEIKWTQADVKRALDEAKPNKPPRKCWLDKTNLTYKLLTME